MKGETVDYKAGIALAFYREAMDRAERAERELLEAQKNARRYRWLRGSGWLVAEKFPHWLSRNALDAAIDAAISAGGKA